MTPEQKANDLVDRFRVILMSEDSDCGDEILCTTIAIQHAHIVADNVIESLDAYSLYELGQWNQIKEELKRL